MAINLNTEPYNDDFDESKNFYQILFKPSLAVQARELTQLQTILRDQIKKFGNHVFQHGSIVIPGNSFSDLAVPYVKLQPKYNNLDLNLSNFEGKTVVGVTSGIKAIVKKAVNSTETDPVTFYLSYISGSSSGGILFSNGEEIYVEDATSSRAILQSSNATGIGSLAYINRGVYYINGTFVFVDKQDVVISKYDNVPSCHVLLKITEEIIDYSEDETLLDNAQGSYNYAAPGADRLKIALTLTTLPLGTALTDDYVEIMRYNEGVLEEHARNPKYSELEKSLARRTYDESGNYVVTGLTPAIREHLQVDNNGGVYPDGDADKFVVEVSAGKAYINGFEVDKISKTQLSVDKARTAGHIKDTSITLRPEFGQYLIVSNVTGTLAIRDREVIDIYNDNDASNASATKIGTARVIGIDYLIGDPSAVGGAVYKLWVTDVNMIGSYKLESAGGIRYQSTKYAYVLTRFNAPVSAGAFTAGEVVTHSTSGRTATVKYWDSATSTLYAYKHDHTKETPKVGDLIVGASSSTNSVLSGKTTLVSVGQNTAVFQLPKAVPYSLKNVDTNAYDLQYTVQKELTIVCDSSGNGSVSVGSGETIDPIEVGTFIAIGTSGIIQNSNFSLNVDGTTLTFAGGSGYNAATIKVYAAVTKKSVSPKTKSLTTNTQTFTSSTSNITLEKTDVVSITSIIDSTGDITTNYDFWNGQSDFAYNRATLTLKQSKPAPVGNVTVTYSYYQHSIAGDFFCIDSYPSDSLEKMLTYVSSSGNNMQLVSCLDFRPSVGADGTFTGSNSRRSDLIISGVTFSSSLQFYVPRIDILTINPVGSLNVISGVPAEQPTVPSAPLDQFVLNQFLIPAYTPYITSIVTKRMDVERFTMNDIKKIVTRVGRVEDFTTLTAAELSVTGVNIVDAATGLDRYKTGYLVENFTTPLSIARTTSGDFSACFVGNTMQPSVEHLSCELSLLTSSSSGFVNKNGYLMLPYTEAVFAKQGLSSRVTNINPFITISWNGLVSVVPSVDDWVEINELPTIYESKTEEVIVNVPTPAPHPPPRPRPRPAPTPAPAPLPAPMFGGWYGQVLGRAGETAPTQVGGQTFSGGVGWWSSDIVQSGRTAEQVATDFLTTASQNFMTGSESMFRSNSTVSMLASNPVLTSTTTFSYGSNGQIVATTTGVNLNGTTFTRSGY